MQNATDRRQKKRAPILCAAVLVLLLGVFLGVVLLPLLWMGRDTAGVVTILLIYALAVAAVMAGVLAALRQRLREIDKGEEDEAKQY